MRALVERVSAVVDEAREAVASFANATTTFAYWRVGVRGAEWRYRPKRFVSNLSVSAGTLMGMAVQSASTVEAIVARLLEALPQTRYPSAAATWEAGVAFARRWAEMSGGEQALALAPRGQECTLTVTIEPWDEKADLAALLARIADPRELENDDE